MKTKGAFLKVGVLCAIALCACDLQPKISSIPDSIGMFIEDRYPALLADPETQPEIYNSAVMDYGVYASPELYGSTNIDDYVLYSSVDDYVLVPDDEEEDDGNKTEDTVDTVEPETSGVPDEQDKESDEDGDYIVVPTYGGNIEEDKSVVEDKIEVKPKVEPKSEVKLEKKPEPKNESKKSDEIVVVRGDTVYSLARKNNMTVAEFAEINKLSEPYNLSIGQKLTTQKPVVKKEVPNVISVEKVKKIESAKVVEKPKIEIKPTSTKRVELTEIVVEKGDTLYSISRKYEIPVNDLAVMNKISAPFALSVGQKIKVPKLDNVETKSVSEIKAIHSPATVNKKTESKKTESKKIESKKTESKKENKTGKQDVVKKSTKPSKTENKQKVANNKKAKISSDPKKQLPKISPRSNSKFSWPLRGKILSGYGPKNGGLVNEGINISGTTGASVLAAENGVVAYAGNEVKGMGNLIIIQHSDGWMTIYAHLNSMVVRRGTKVRVGDKLGTVGQTGKVDKPQLHFEIRRGTKSYNPIQYLKK